MTDGNRMSQQIGLPFDPLRDFEERIPYRTRCSNTKRFEHILPKEQAIEFPYIQINYPRVDYIVYDLDYPSAPIAAEEKGLPFPTLTVISPDSHHAHLLYELLYPVPRKHSKSTKAFLSDIIFGYKELLCADKAITTQKQLVKNALWPGWEILQGHLPFSLSELAEAIPSEINRNKTFEPPKITALRIKSFADTLNLHSRNCSLFENARFFAYAVVHEHHGERSLYDAILEHVEYLNDIEIPKHFPVKINHIGELRSIARSIAGWTWKNRTQFRPVKPVNKGVMAFPSMRGVYWEPDEFKKEVKKRRRASARRTSRIKKEATREKIQEAIRLCIKHGFKLTVSNISTLAGVSRPTLYNHDYTEIIKSVKFGLSR